VQIRIGPSCFYLFIQPAIFTKLSHTGQFYNPDKFCREQRLTIPCCWAQWRFQVQGASESPYMGFQSTSGLSCRSCPRTSNVFQQCALDLLLISESDDRILLSSPSLSLFLKNNIMSSLSNARAIAVQMGLDSPELLCFFYPRSPSFFHSMLLLSLVL
jgi:hypothetical protein